MNKKSIPTIYNGGKCGYRNAEIKALSDTAITIYNGGKCTYRNDLTKMCSKTTSIDFIKLTNLKIA